MAGPLILYTLLIIAASLLGGFIPLFMKLTHRRMQYAISFVGGVMFGVGLLHMLTHALEAAPGQQTMLWMIGGFLLMFFVERFFCFHHHDVPQDVAVSQHNHQHEPGHEHHHHQHCTHGHEHAGDKPHPDHKLSWGGAALGMTLHSIIGGVALASAMLAEKHVSPAAAWPGVAAFAVIVLHKPFDALTVITLTRLSSMSKFASHMINLLFSLAVPAGAALALLGMEHWIAANPMFIAYALAFSAGTFICVALSDLLPELQFHHHDRIGLSAALVLGIALSWGLGILEHGTHHHDHDGHNHGAHVEDAHAGHDDHTGHDHASHMHDDHAGHDHASTPATATPAKTDDHADHNHDDHAGHDH
ncbi:MAG: iron permease [Phycisphaeraceae bacterium]|nr:iron permease [Phycisphaeraceae bacterium]